MTDTNLGAAAGGIFAKAFTLIYETGRLIPAGGMALTAEQVEDVRAVAWYTGAGLSRAPMAEIHRLRALFPATEPAEAVRDGSDLVVVQRSHTAKAVQSWMTLDLWTDLGKNNKDFDAEYERQGFGDLWATLLGEVRALVQATTPAPAEPAEEAAPRCDAVSIYGDRCFKTSGHDDGHKAFNCTWDSTYSAPTEPAEEATKAVTWTVNTTYHLEGPSETSDDKERIPTPTEAEWPTWHEVPEGRTVLAKNRHTYTKRDGILCIGTSTMKSCMATSTQHLAPFVAAEEG